MDRAAGSPLAWRREDSVGARGCIPAGGRDSPTALVTRPSSLLILHVSDEAEALRACINVSQAHVAAEAAGALEPRTPPSALPHAQERRAGSQAPACPGYHIQVLGSKAEVPN